MLRNLQQYHRPDNLQDAIDLLRQGAPSTQPLAGGTTLLAADQKDVEAVVDLRDLGLSYIRVQGATLHLGATTTLSQLIDASELQTFSSGVLPEAVQAVSGRNQRNAATLGGTIAAGDGQDPLLTTLLALDANLTVYAPQARQMPLPGFLAYRQRLLDSGALISEIRLPLLVGPLGAAYKAVGRTPRDQPIVCAVARLEMAHGIGSNVRLALGGGADLPVRALDAERLLERKELSPQRIHEAAQKASQDLTPPGDFRGSSEYRRAMANVLARRALSQAIARAAAERTASVN